MMTRNCILTAYIALQMFSAAQCDQSYLVERTITPPTIDGILGPGEWDGVMRAGAFTLLREPEGTPDKQNWRMAATWDDDNMYLLLTTDYTGWVEGHNAGLQLDCGDQLNCGGSNFGGNPDSLNLYFDPNVDDLPNEAPANGYQIGFGLNRGTSYYRDSEISNTFLYQEAHVDTSFGNQGKWGTGEHNGHAQWSFEANVGDDGGVVEMVLPWNTWDAPHDRLLNVGPPKMGDVWYVNAGVISSQPSNFLPLWNWNSSQSFVTRPDGEFIFAPVPEPTSLGLVATAFLPLLWRRSKTR